VHRLRPKLLRGGDPGACPHALAHRSRTRGHLGNGGAGARRLADCR
jgi:hypothetical protein